MPFTVFAFAPAWSASTPWAEPVSPIFTVIPSSAPCVSNGERDREPTSRGARFRKATAGAGLKVLRWPIVSIWQGEVDGVVDADNAANC